MHNIDTFYLAMAQPPSNKRLRLQPRRSVAPSIQPQLGPVGSAIHQSVAQFANQNVSNASGTAIVPRVVESMSSSLNLHGDTPTQAVITNSRLEPFQPINSISDDVRFIQFKLKTTMNDLILPCESYISLDLEIVKTSTAGGDLRKVIPVNGVGSAIFKNLGVKYNGQQIESGDGLYAYRADLEKRLLHGSEAKKFDMDLAMYTSPEVSWDNLPKAGPWGIDKPVKVQPDGVKGEAAAGGAVVNISVKKDLAALPIGAPEPPELLKTGEYASYDGSNVIEMVHPAFRGRVQWASAGKRFQVIDTIHSNIFNQCKHLPPNSTLDLTFDLQDDPKFSLLSNDIGNRSAGLKIKIHAARILTRVDTLDPATVEEMIMLTEQNKRVYKFPSMRVDMNYLVRTSGINDLSETAALLKDNRRIPRRVFIGAVKQNAFHGNLELDPFNYADVGANSVLMRVGGQVRPVPELRCDRSARGIEQGVDYSQFLFSLLLSTGTMMGKVGLGINRFNYGTGNFLLGFDLTSGDSEGVYEFPEQKNIELHYHLQEALKEAYALVIFAEYDQEFQIDENGIIVTI